MIHDEYNPYTAVQRYPSQWFVFVPSAEQQNTETTLSVYSFANLVPEVIRPVYASTSTLSIDTRSAGNPYSHHPNFTTPSQYFGHLEEPSHNLLKTEEVQDDTLTITDIQNLENPFTSHGRYYPSVQINPPNDVTLNKHVFSSESTEDIKELHVTFPMKHFDGFTNNSAEISAGTPTVNKKLLSPESMYELAQHHVDFETKGNGLHMRHFSPESMMELSEEQMENVF